MKKTIIYLLLAGCIVTSCSMTSQLKRAKVRANISLPQRILAPEQKKGYDQRSVLEFSDLKGKKTTYATTEKDKNGKDQITVELQGVTVVAKSRTVPERFGKVDIDFVVSVSEKLLGEKRQLTLTPRLLKKNEEIPFSDLIISGGRFSKTQLNGYKKYEEYLKTIIPDSAFLDKLVNQKAYRRYFVSYDQSEKRKLRKDSLIWAHYDAFTAKTNKRYILFNEKMYRNRIWLSKALGYELIKDRYELFERDTIHISRFFGHRYEAIVSLFPQFHLLRFKSDNTTPYKYKRFPARIRRTYHKLTPEDSISILKRYYRYKRIARNEKLKAEKEKKFAELVKFPKNPNAHLDTVIYRKGRFEYYYHQEVATDENSKRMQLYLSGHVLNTNRNSYTLPTSDTLSYVVSSMLQFMDLTPRYQQKIVERKAITSVKAYITFPVGKSTLLESLGENRKEIEKVQEMTKKLTDTDEFLMDSITLVAGSSPEGSYSANLQLSKSRAESLKKYLRTKLNEIKGIDTLLKARWRGEDWNGLIRLINETTAFYPKSELLKLVDKSGNPDQKEKMLKAQLPAQYAIIRKELYPQLRAVDFTFHVHRAGMIKDTIHTTEPDTLYADAIKLMQERKYSKALTILTEYNDWNTAICLMSLGYDENACNLLLKEKLSADREYLLAILIARLNREEEAVKYYRHACEMDDSKRWRGALDPEINRLIKKYDLNKENPSK